VGAGIGAGEPHLDVAGRQLGGDLDGDLREEVEQLQPQIRRERLAEAARDLGGALVAEVGEPLQVFLDSLEHDCQIHLDITMTSPEASVNCQNDAARVLVRLVPVSPIPEYAEPGAIQSVTGG